MRTTLKLTVRGLWRLVHWRKQMIVLVKDLDEVVPQRRDAGDLRLEEIARRHLPALAEINRERMFRSATARFAHDLDIGYRGFVAFKGDRLAGFYWWIDRDAQPPSSRWSIGAAISELGLEIDLGEGDVYGADLFVREEDREGGTAQAVLDQVESSLRERGYRRLWGYVLEDNLPARWTYSLRGYRPMWRVVQVRTPFGRRSWTEAVEDEDRRSRR